MPRKNKQDKQQQQQSPNNQPHTTVNFDDTIVNAFDPRHQPRIKRFRRQKIQKDMRKR